MPNGVPVSWMAGFWRHSPVVAVSGRRQRPSPTSTATATATSTCATSPWPPGSHLRRSSRRSSPTRRRSATTSCSPRRTRSRSAVCCGDRFGLPRWQFTLSASGANVDALRLARAFTGRQKVVVFQAKYHGHLDELLWSDGRAGRPRAARGLRRAPRHRALQRPRRARRGTGRRRRRRRAARAGHDQLRARACRNRGSTTLFGLSPASTGRWSIADVTHTQFAVLRRRSPGVRPRPGHHHRWQGHRGRHARRCLRHDPGAVRLPRRRTSRATSSTQPSVPTGGTVYANALSMAAARAGLAEVFTPEAHDRVDGLGARLQHGLQQLVDAAGLPFTIDRWGGRVPVAPDAPSPPSPARTATGSVDEAFADARKAFYANRGIWDAIATSGPGDVVRGDRARTSTPTSTPARSSSPPWLSADASRGG